MAAFRRILHVERGRRAKPRNARARAGASAGETAVGGSVRREREGRTRAKWARRVEPRNARVRAGARACKTASDGHVRTGEVRRSSSDSLLSTNFPARPFAVGRCRLTGRSLLQGGLAGARRAVRERGARVLVCVCSCARRAGRCVGLASALDFGRPRRVSDLLSGPYRMR
ncbi:uncharacterized protein C8Q71DRAFT_214478 [Rhodofomes roseus]|uniref:Uncharacterized protein n=1 Tax=Rhodofomes roseus TaxID=34475 RepID=A0ABQ8KUA4_9APHY|nr:uncharacterized protein C8Q71DRAFT_214478 [Rhodofomes roseus]KAH9842660.1 hypothetical protein C8Q71DRAFT_214478 [Rhodofomes roseus]